MLFPAVYCPSSSSFHSQQGAVKSTASPCNLWPEPSIAFILTTHPFQPQAWITADNKGGACGCPDSIIVTSSENYSLWLHPTTHKDGMDFCLFLQILNSRKKKDQNVVIFIILKMYCFARKYTNKISLTSADWQVFNEPTFFHIMN